MISMVTTGNANTKVSVSGSRVISLSSVRTSRPIVVLIAVPPISSPCCQLRAPGLLRRVAVEQLEQRVLEVGHLDGRSVGHRIPAHQGGADVGDDAPVAAHGDPRADRAAPPRPRPESASCASSVRSARLRQAEADRRLRACRSISSAGVPESRTRPARITTTRSQSASASSSSWVTSSTVVPRVVQLAHRGPHVAPGRRVQALGELVEDHQARAG